MFNGILSDNFIDCQYLKIQIIGVIILNLFCLFCVKVIGGMYKLTFPATEGLVGAFRILLQSSQSWRE